MYWVSEGGTVNGLVEGREMEMEVVIKGGAVLSHVEFHCTHSLTHATHASQLLQPDFYYDC